jgi:anti-sigma B factor antagonist
VDVQVSRQDDERRNDFGIDVTRNGDEADFALSGELDLSTAPRLWEQLHLVLESGAKKVTCDLAALRYMDSTGLNVMIALHKRLKASDGTLILKDPTTSVRRVFEITGVDEFLAIEPRRAEH